MCGLPIWLEVVIERPDGPCSRVSLQGMALQYASSAYGPAGYGAAERIRPRAEAWRDFLTALEAAGVWQWAADYTTPPAGEIIWSVEIAQHFRNISSSGTNALPPGDRFAAFCAALGRLLDREIK